MLPLRFCIETALRTMSSGCSVEEVFRCIGVFVGGRGHKLLMLRWSRCLAAHVYLELPERAAVKSTGRSNARSYIIAALSPCSPVAETPICGASS